MEGGPLLALWQKPQALHDPLRNLPQDVKNAAGVVRGAVGVPAQRVRHADLVGGAHALRDEDD